MPKRFVTLLGKSIQKVARLRGGGSALPGLVVERIDPNFIKHTLAQLPMGVAVISGTNGKTTTTKMVVELLQSQGLKVFTNRTGSNFTRGVAAALLKDIGINGKLNADIAVLELDEAHAVHFVDKIPPRYSLLLNVMRDQLDRFGEINHTAKLLAQVAKSTTDTIVLNREDPLIFDIAKQIKNKKITLFGLSKDLIATFPSDDDLHTHSSKANDTEKADVILQSFANNSASFYVDGKKISTKLKLNGIYNVYNAAAALAFTRAILSDKIDEAKLIDALSGVQPAFGRGEKILVNGQPLELVLVKNPSGFQLGLESFPANGYITMIAINDNYADGRDMSWLWDVDFISLQNNGVDFVSGIRAYDMALRLQYDEVPVRHVDQRLITALSQFIKAHGTQPKRIFCTYTAMLDIRRSLKKIAKVEDIK